MATREALEAGGHKERARRRLMDMLHGEEGVRIWDAALALERAAIKVGEVRERGRKRRKAARP